MPQSRDDLERQLNMAKKDRDACAAVFQQAGVAERALKAQPAWRNANALCRQLTRRLLAVSKKEKLAVEVAARREAAASEE
jgi:hypothetical protein